MIDIIRQKHTHIMPSHFELMIIREIEKRNKRKIPYISILEFLIKRDKKNEILLKFSFILGYIYYYHLLIVLLKKVYFNNYHIIKQLKLYLLIKVFKYFYQY